MQIIAESREGGRGVRILRRNRQRIKPWRKVKCSCGCKHINAFRAGDTVRFEVDVCSCPEGTQHTVMLDEGEIGEAKNEQYH